MFRDEHTDPAKCWIWSTSFLNLSSATKTDKLGASFILRQLTDISLSIGDSNIGNCLTSPTIDYTINGSVLNNVSIVEKLDGEVINTYTDLVNDSKLTINISSQFDKLSYGKHNIDIDVKYNNELLKTINILFNKIKAPIATLPTTASLKQTIAHNKEIDKEIDYQLVRFEEVLKEKSVGVTEPEKKMSTLIDKVKSNLIGYCEEIPSLQILKKDQSKQIVLGGEIPHSYGIGVSNGMFFHHPTKKSLTNLKENGESVTIDASNILGSITVNDKRDKIYYICSTLNQNEIELNILNIYSYDIEKFILSVPNSNIVGMDIYENSNELYLFEPGKIYFYNLSELVLKSTLILQYADVCTEATKDYFVTNTKVNRSETSPKAYNKTNGTQQHSTNTYHHYASCHKEKNLLVAYDYNNDRIWIIDLDSPSNKIGIVNSDDVNKHIYITDNYICYSGNSCYLYDLQGLEVLGTHRIGNLGYINGYWVTPNYWECAGDRSFNKVMEISYSYIEKK